MSTAFPGQERLKHCRLVMAGAAAEGLLVFGERLEGHMPEEKARSVPQSILAASDCSVSELVAMKDEIVALRDRLNAVIGE